MKEVQQPYFRENGELRTEFRRSARIHWLLSENYYEELVNLS